MSVFPKTKDYILKCRKDIQFTAVTEKRNRNISQEIWIWEFGIFTKSDSKIWVDGK